MRALLLALSILLSSSPAFAQLIFPPGPSGGGVPVGGSGTAGKIPKWSTSTNLTDSLITESGTTLSMTGTFNATNFNGILGATTPAAITGTTITGTTSLTTPIHYGGTTASSTLTLQSTSGVGTTDAINLKVGNNGAVTALSLATGGAATFTASANTVPITSSGYSVTGSGTSSLFSASGTLNTSGVVHVNDWSITNTASDSTSTAFRIRGGAAGATDRFAVRLSDGAISQTGAFTYNGLTVTAGNDIGSFNGGAIKLTTNFTAFGALSFSIGGGNTISSTSGGANFIQAFATFNPGSGSASFAGLHLNPTINGTSSGTAYGLLLASKTNTLTGGTVRLASMGTTTTDGFTGYSEKFAVNTSGDLSLGGAGFQHTGISLVTGSIVGVSGATLQISSGNNATAGNYRFTTSAVSTGNSATVGVDSSFTPSSGSPNYALLHLNPTINGTSSGTAYGLLLASKTNTLTGGTVRLASFGTTTTDGFTGYTEALGIRTTGQVDIAGSNMLSVSGGNAVVGGGFSTVHVGGGSSVQLGGLGTLLTLTAGAVGMNKMTASASAPGASGAKLEVVCGTTAGTAKLIIYAGTSSTAKTVVDDIGGGVTGC